MNDPIYRAPAPMLDEQYAELAWGMGIDPEPDRVPLIGSHLCGGRLR